MFYTIEIDEEEFVVEQIMSNDTFDMCKVYHKSNDITLYLNKGTLQRIKIKFDNIQSCF